MGINSGDVLGMVTLLLWGTTISTAHAGTETVIDGERHFRNEAEPLQGLEVCSLEEVRLADSARKGHYASMFKRCLLPFLIYGILAAASARTVRVADVATLSAALSRAAGEPGTVIELAPGEYHLIPGLYTDPACGNCEDPAQAVPATVGLRITGVRVTLHGTARAEVRIHTHAGYGLLIEDCEDCRLSGLTITGGERDTSGLATDAGIVVRRSLVSIEHCRIAENVGDSATVAETVVGIMGICGRSGARIRVHQCELLRNSWDGIALYRDAEAHITESLIDGIDSGRGGPDRGGRGVGIGVTWNARATIERCLVKRYWKGIGLFVDAEGVVRDNVIEDVLTWGIALWDAGKGFPYGEIMGNAVYRTGACGISVTREREGGRAGSRIVRNALVRTGGNSKYDAADYYCYQQALAVHGRTIDMTIAENHRFDNREAGDARGSEDLPEASFRAAIAPIVTQLLRSPLTAQSGFCRNFSPPTPPRTQ